MATVSNTQDQQTRDEAPAQAVGAGEGQGARPVASEAAKMAGAARAAEAGGGRSAVGDEGKERDDDQAQKRQRAAVEEGVGVAAVGAAKTASAGASEVEAPEDDQRQIGRAQADAAAQAVGGRAEPRAPDGEGVRPVASEAPGQGKAAQAVPRSVDAGGGRSAASGEANEREDESGQPQKVAESPNVVDLKPSGRELEKGQFVVPLAITRAYAEVDGKFFAKDSNRVMFEDRGSKLATSTTDKKTIEDMVTYAKAKQWESLKLTGSKEFRQQAWLQAESQGIRTEGYTPKDADLAALATLRDARTTNEIKPLKEQAKEAPRAQPPAPRHDIDKSQASLHKAAEQGVTTNLEALQKVRGLADRSLEQLTKLAYWRGVVGEHNKSDPKKQAAALANFDKEATKPEFLKQLEALTPDRKEAASERDRSRAREPQSQSL